jgi:hypothetical protein
LINREIVIPSKKSSKDKRIAKKRRKVSKKEKN